MIESVFRSPRVQLRLQRSFLGLQVFEAMTVYLVERRHPLTTIQQYIQNVEHFDRWIRRAHCPPVDLGEESVARFLAKHLPRCRCPAPACTTLHQVRASLRHLLVVLRLHGFMAWAERISGLEAGQHHRSPGGSCRVGWKRRRHPGPSYDAPDPIYPE